MQASNKNLLINIWIENWNDISWRCCRHRGRILDFAPPLRHLSHKICHTTNVTHHTTKYQHTSPVKGGVAPWPWKVRWWQSWLWIEHLTANQSQHRYLNCARQLISCAFNNKLQPSRLRRRESFSYQICLVGKNIFPRHVWNFSKQMSSLNYFPDLRSNRNSFLYFSFTNFR